MSRTVLISLGLVALAIVLLALSFVPWGDEPAETIAPTVTHEVRIAPTRTTAEIGRTLFTIKGCATCHRHDGLNVARLSFGGETIRVSESFLVAGAPDLTHYQPEPDFVRQWLSDPRAIRPNTTMPNLGLTEDEIEALLAFLQTNKPE
ncbi:MAG TPA: c-type cytochrome [Promineifilum sp.]